MTFEQFDVVVVPFPFTDRNSTKRRPAVVVSTPGRIHAERSLLAMITTSEHEKWPLDQEISDLNAAGLTTPCVIRLKLFTLDHDLIVRKIGCIASSDAELLKKKLLHAMGL